MKEKKQTASKTSSLKIKASKKQSTKKKNRLIIKKISNIDKQTNQQLQ